MIYAFFDIDGTLINTTSMQDFLDYYFLVKDKSLTKGQRYVNTVWHCLEHLPISRAWLNRLYYFNYQEASVAEVSSIGESWFNYQLKTRHPSTTKP